MTKPIIGIVARDETINNTLYQAITKNNMKYLDNCNCIGILNYSNNNIIDEEILKLCDGIIITGGIDIYKYHFNIVKYCIRTNTPLLGICMGHQILGLYSNNNNMLIPLDNHYSLNNEHTINIKKNSNLYKIFGPIIITNTRHLYKLNNCTKPFKIVATSNDKTIEAIEYINKKCFLLGVQFHPEDMDNMQPLYNYFIEEIKKRKNI